MLKVVLYLTYGNLKLHAQCRHISVYTKSDVILETQCCNLVGGAFSTWDINCSALVVLDVFIFGNQTAESHVTPVFCMGVPFGSQYVFHDTVENCLFFFF